MLKSLPTLGFLAIALSFATVGVVSTRSRAADTEAVKLESLKWDALMAKLAKAKSENYKYTLIDVWSTTCGPCKTNFPHVVEMHKKYADKGLQVISLSLDDISDTKAIADAKKFLTEKEAKFTNVLLDEEFGVGFDKFEINAIPAVFLYGPDGRLLQRFTWDDPKNQFTYEQVEKAVAERLGIKTAIR